MREVGDGIFLQRPIASSKEEADISHIYKMLYGLWYLYLNVLS
jgi:hypothetical protein